MSLNPRNLSYFLKHKIIYRRDPLNDQPTDSFDWGYWYEQGTYECYTLFASRAKINTYKSLKWHLYTLWYLNPQLDQDLFTSLAKIMCNKVNGFVTFDISEQLMQSMIYEVSLQDLDFAPKNKLRKIIFKDSCKLDMRQKLSIVGQMVGRSKLSENEIYDAMLLINDENKKITVTNISGHLKCSPRTVHRNMSNELKKEKELLNQQLN